MILLLLLLAQAPAPTVTTTCTIERVVGGGNAIVTKTRREFLCETAPGGLRTVVEKAWFKAHCHRYDGNNRVDHTWASCDAPAPVTRTPGEPVARPSAWRDHLKAFAYGALAAVAGAIYLAGGGGPR